MAHSNGGIAPRSRLVGGLACWRHVLEREDRDEVDPEPEGDVVARDLLVVGNELAVAVQPGEVVGLVGGSGGGKSTVIRLLCGFYAPQQGTVSLNGRDVLRDFTPAELVQNIAWVTQEPQLFPLSVAENIAYGLNPDTYTMADVERYGGK